MVPAFILLQRLSKKALDDRFIHIFLFHLTRARPPEPLFFSPLQGDCARFA